MSPTDSENTSAQTVADPPHGFTSDHNPPATKTPDPIRGALEQFDRQVAKARAEPSKVMQSLRLAQLVERDLSEEQRAIFTQLAYESFPKNEGGLGLQISFRRNPKAAGELHKLREAAIELLAHKRRAIQEG